MPRSRARSIASLPAEIARAQAALAEAEAALAAAQHIEAQTAIYAPIDGNHLHHGRRPSEFAEAGNLLLQMADLHHERVRAYFDEPDLGRLAVGQKVSIRWDAKPDREWHGHIYASGHGGHLYHAQRGRSADRSRRLPEDGLLPDTNVTVTVTISSEPNALSMPREALHEQNGKYFVFKIVGDELKRVPVTIGSPNMTQVRFSPALRTATWSPPEQPTGSPCRRAYRSRKCVRPIREIARFGGGCLRLPRPLWRCAQISAATLAQANAALQAGEADRPWRC